jgi:flagellar capping protein FliD
VDVRAGMTLNQLRDAINNVEGADVSASIINDGTATNSHRLVLPSSETGAANNSVVSQNDTTLNFSTTTIEAAVASSGTYTGANTKNVLVEIVAGGSVGAATYKVSLDGGLTF